MGVTDFSFSASSAKIRDLFIFAEPHEALAQAVVFGNRPLYLVVHKLIVLIISYEKKT